MTLAGEMDRKAFTAGRIGLGLVLMAVATGLSGCGALVEPSFAKAGLTLRVRYRISQIMTILGMVQAGDGVAVMPELSLPGDLACAYPHLKAVAFRPAIRRRVGLGLRDLSRAAPAVQAFVETARHVAKRP